MGIDFYIDALRFLPDKVTATKVYMQVYNIDYEEIFEKETCLPELDSFSFNPMFNFRRELRKDHIDPTSIVLLTVITIDKATNETRIVGYAVVPLFITTGPNPVHPTDKNISVNFKPIIHLFLELFINFQLFSFSEGRVSLQRCLSVTFNISAGQKNCAFFMPKNVKISKTRQKLLISINLFKKQV